MEGLPDENLSEIMKKVADIAKKDGVITEEEYSILEQLSFDVAEYLITLEDAQEDGKIDADEKVKLKYIKDKIVSNAEAIAEEDGIIEEDEQALVDKLIEILDDY